MGTGQGDRYKAVWRRTNETARTPIGRPQLHRLTDGQTVILDEVYGNGRIYALSRDNTAVTEIKPKVLLDDSLYFPYLAPIDDHQLLCLSGKSPREIVTISHLGEVVQRIWNSWNPDNLLWPRCVATWGDDLVVADGNIQRGSGARPPGICIMTKTGKVLWQWRPGSSEHGLTDPKHVLPLPNGRIVVTEPDVHRVLCLDLNGQICWIYGEYGKPGREFGRLAGPCSTSLTSRETLLVADTLNCRLIELNLEGRFLRHIGGDRDSIGAPVGPLAYPFGAVDEPDQNATLVADTGNLRVARIHQGTVETLAGASRPPRRLLS